MNFPSMAEVEAATQTQLARWYRFLPSPGVNHVGTGSFCQKFRQEISVMDQIMLRLRDFGGITVAISKEIGFVQP